MTRSDYRLAPTEEGVSLAALLGFATHARRGLVIWNRDLKVVGFNRFSCEYLGMEIADLQLGWTYDELVNKIEQVARETRDGSVWDARLPLTDFETAKRLLAEKPDTVARLPGRNDDGVYVTRSILDDRYMLSILTDMRDLEREQQETKLEQVYLKTILENITDGAMMVDRDHMVTVCNRQMLQLLNIDPDKVSLPMEVSDFVRLHGDITDLPPDIREKFVEERASVAKGEKDVSGSYRVARHLRNGKILEVIRVGLPHGGGVLTVSDATERAELARQRKMFKTVIDHIDEGVTLVRRSGAVELVNERMMEIYGVDHADAKHGDHIEVFVRASQDLKALPEDQREEEVARRIHATTHQEPGTYFQTRNLHDGRSIAVVRSVLEDGRSVSTYRDVTKETERQQLLEEAKQAAEDANRMKSNFLAKVTHDLRTPMHGVLGMASILERSELTASQARTLDMLVQSGNHMVDLIDGLLTISTHETGDLRLEPEPSDLRELVERCV